MDTKSFEEEKTFKIKQMQHSLKMDTDGFKAAQGAANELVALQNSKHKELAAIGKAAAIFQITTDTARGAMSAYASLAPIPIVGPALGAAAAAAVIAYGVERLSSATSASFAVGTPNIPQDQLATVHQGEMIVPATFSEAIRAGDLSLSGPGGGQQQNNEASTVLNISFDGANFIGSFDETTIQELGHKLSDAISQGLISPIPTRRL